METRLPAEGSLRSEISLVVAAGPVLIGGLYAWTQSYGSAVGVWCVAMVAALLATLTLPRSLPECAGAVA
ncbi:MAG: hypothetical protein JRG89_04595 [Deltaproteobacteria bacterium]|nr:hypothetical protein [Deltaproteobacteria bacterium]MBW2387696.1 hypothetical protein [Deltaproteobacteria bacterium]